MIIGTPGNDRLVGTAGNDELLGLAGDDALLGGDGVDTALYAGSRSGYRISSPRLGTWVVTDISLADGDEGSDTLTGLEKLRFADGDLKLIDYGEFQVNTWVRDFQGDPALAPFAEGGWLAAWSSYGQDGDGMGVYAQRYGADGLPAGTEVRLNTVTAGEQREVAVAALTGGGFVAVWSTGEPGYSLQVVGRRFADDGTPLGGEFPLDSGFAGYQFKPVIVARPDGGFTVVWETMAYGLTHLTARSFTAAGAPLGSAFQVDASAPPDGGLYEVAAAARSGGGFAAIWQSDPLDGLGPRAIVRVFAADGSPIGAETAVGNRVHGEQTTPRIASLAGGGFVATWCAAGDPDTGAGIGIYAQRLDASGNAGGAVLRVSAESVDPYDDRYDEPVVAGLAGGGFVVCWLGAVTDYVDVLARRFAADGTPIGAQFLVNTVTDGQQWTPTVTALADGGFVIGWRSDGVDSPLWGDWGTGGVFAQRYSAGGEPVTAYLPSATEGTPIDDFLVGTPAVETLQGFDGDDALVGGGDDDRLDGGAGVDEARYAGPMADYVFSNTAAYVFDVGDTNAANGDEGSDALAGIERVRFADGAVEVAQASEFVLASGGTLAQYPGARDVALARFADGRLIATWTGSDGMWGGVFAQLLAADATALAPVFRVNTTTWLSQTTPSVATLPDGGFLIAWDSAQDGSESGIYAQRYAASGSAVGSEYRINTFTHSDQLRPLIAMQPSGAHLIIWHSLDQDGSGYGIYGQRFTADGMPAGGEFRVSETTAGNQVRPSFALLADGSYVIAWMAELPNAYPFDAEIYARRYASDGTALGGEFRVNSYTTLDQGYPSVAALPGGGYVIVWHSQGQDGDGYGVYGQRYAASGAALGGEFRVNTATAEPQSVPTVAALPDGGFVVAWSSGYYNLGAADEDDRDLYGQRFAADASSVGGEFRINSRNAGDQEFVTIITLADGGTLFAWNSNDAATGESSIEGQRFGADGVKFNELTVTGTDGNDTLRGGDGTQVLVGGKGNDTYEADLVHDRIVETAEGGHDTLWSRRSVVLPEVIEDLRLLGEADLDGTGNASDNGITGNDGSNRLAGLAGDDRLHGGGSGDWLDGGPGGDILEGGHGNDDLNGGPGTDIAVYAGANGGYAVTRIGTDWHVIDGSGNEGADTLVSVERLRFADRAIAIDLDGAAGNTAKLIGAIFDEQFLIPEFVGIGIGLFDTGWSMLEVAQLALDTGLFAELAGSGSNADFVRLVYENVVGVEPGAGDQSYFQGILDRGEMTQAQMAVFAAETAENAANIDLIGLSDSGIEFLPLGV